MNHSPCAEVPATPQALLKNTMNCGWQFVRSGKLRTTRLCAIFRICDVGPQTVRCGPATVLQPSLPSHGLHCKLHLIHIRSKRSLWCRSKRSAP